MFRKKDVWLIGVVLVAALGLFLFQYAQGRQAQATGYVRIWVDGKVHSEIPLGEEKSIVIRQENGCENVVHLLENGFYMESSTCDNQLCIGQGEVTTENYTLRSLYSHVLCLPNRVDVELVLSRMQEDGPDI